MLHPPHIWLYPHIGRQQPIDAILNLDLSLLFFLTQGKLYVNYNHLAKQIKCSFEILVLEDG